MTTKITLNNIADTALATLTGPKVTTVVYPGTETATDIAGGETINLTGSGYQSGCSVLVASTAASVVTFINGTQISFIAPALAAGTYVIYVINPDGGTAISIPGISYSGTPNWSTSAGTLGTVYETGSISTTLTAAGDAPITYTLASGTLPAGSTLNSTTGFLSGTASSTVSSTTYSFTITAKDAQSQTTNRAFSLTIDPDAVTWDTPSAGATYTVGKDSAIANIVMSATSAAGGSITYTADTLPTGLSVTGANIAGTPTIAANTSTVLTATSTATRTSTRTINWVVNVSNDIYFKNTSLLLNGDTTPFIADASTNAFSLTPAGSVKANESNPFQDGYYSGYFNNSISDVIKVASNATAFAIGTGNFTVEGWFNSVDYTHWQHLFHLGGSGHYGIVLYRDNSNDIIVQIEGTTVINYAFTPVLGAWYHFALVRAGTGSNQTTLYLNGVSVATGTSTGNISADNIFIGGLDWGTGNNWSGYISNVRLIKGVALYTEQFNPPTAPLTTTESAVTYTAPATVDYLVVAGGGGGGYLMGGGGGAGGMLTSTGFAVASNTGFAVAVGAGGVGALSQIPGGYGGSSAISATTDVTYSGVFTGASYIRKAGAGVLATAGGDLTIETWIYSNTSSITGLYDGGPGEAGIIRNIQANIFGWQGNDGAGANITGKFPVSTWFHLAITYSSSGSVVKAYVNGGLVATGAAGAYSVGANFDIGATNGTASFNGYLSNYRVTNRLVYNANFTPPISPLAAVANTSYLVFKNATIIDNSTNNYTITPNQVTVSSTVIPPVGILAFGGGGGGTWESGAGLPGGSGGGGSAAEGTGGVGGAGITGQGNAGGAGAGGRLAGGGGGAGSIGGIAGATASNAGSGGIGLSSSITGTPTYYAGGGGGGTDPGNTSTLPGRGGIGGGGKGGGLAIQNTAGMSNSGGGGGGGANNAGGISYLGANGGSGIVAIRYPDSYSPAITTGKPTVIVTGGYRIYVFTTSGTIKFSTATTPSVLSNQTVLLTCQSNRFIDTSTTASAITVTGTPKIAQVIPYTLPINTYGSGYFNGTTDYITTPLSTNFDFGTGDFTIECWIQLPTIPTSGYYSPLSQYSGATAGAGYWSLEIDFGASTNTTAIYYNGSTKFDGTNAAFKAGQWYHLAIARSNTALTFYVNGVASGSITYTGKFGINDPFVIGCQPSPRGGYTLGYISNVRVVKGTALYTAAFTPPPSPLTAVTNTALLTLQTKQSHNNNTYQDASGYNNLLTPSGTPSQGTFSPFSQTGWSTYFNGSTDYLSMPSTANINVSTGDFTAECWFFTSNIAQASAQTLIWLNGNTSAYAGIRLGLDTSGLSFYISVDGSTWTVNTGAIGTVASNTWYHAAVTRSGNSFRVFLNGTQVGTTYTQAGTLYAGTLNYIGALNYSAIVSNPYRQMNGYISNVRVVKGTAVYTANFTPATTPLTAITNTVLLTCQDNRFIDNSVYTNRLTASGTPKIQAFSPFSPTASYDPVLNGGSTYFNGSTDYLTAPVNTSLAFGTGSTVSAMTAEAWFYVNTAISTDQTIISQYASGSAGWSIRVYSSLMRVALTGDTTLITGTTTLVPYTWYHVALSGSAGSWKLFLNGVQESTTQTSSVTMGDAAAVTIGRLSNVSYFNGYISNVVITKGVVKYTGNFYVPTALVPRTTSTVLLVNSTSAAITDASGKNNLSTIGDAKISTAVKKYGTGSMYFDGTGDYLSVLTSTQLQFGTGDFTIEMWIYPVAVGTGSYTYPVLLACGSGDGAAAGEFSIYIAHPSGQNMVYYYTSPGAYINGGTNPATGTWSHVALVKSSGTLKYFVNGVQQWTVAMASAMGNNTSTWSIGTRTGNLAQCMFNGYIDDLRITQGVARYTATFTPPTSASVTR